MSHLLHFVFATRAARDAFAAAVDAEEGYPKDSIDIGRGPHAPKSETRTLRHQDGVNHPTLAEAAYPRDEVVVRLVAQARVTVPGGTRIEVLDESWRTP